MQSDAFYIRDTCRLCKSMNLATVLSLTPTAICDAYLTSPKKEVTYPLNLMMCENCGFVQIDCVINPELIYRDYLFTTTSSLPLASHFQKYARTLLGKLNDPQSSFVIDIGSNEGTLLRELKIHGVKVLGVEPASEIANLANETGVPTLCSYFSSTVANEIRKRHGLADAITVNNLFANIDDLEDFIFQVKKILKPGGLFIIESSYLGDMIDNLVFDFIYHEHLSYLSVNPLKNYFSNNDMTLVDIQQVETKGGSLRYYVENMSHINTEVPKVAEWVENEKNAKLYEKITYHGYAKRIEKCKLDLANFLSKYDKNKVVGYGASATSTTLLYHFGLAGKIAYLVDDNSAKIGTFSPGLNIPVTDTRKIYEGDIDIVVVLAWRYAQAIMNKHKDFEGKFVVPLPNLSVN